MEYGLIFILIACCVGFWMTWGVGANDLANIMSTTMGSKALSVRQALIIAIIFEILGAFLGGSEVTETVRGGIIDLQAVSKNPVLLIYCMLSVLLASASWITTASMLGMPVSITQAIVGGLVGVGAISLGLNAIEWHNVAYIFMSWVISPSLAGLIAFILFISIRQTILAVEEPVKTAQFIMPIYFFLIGLVLAVMTVLKTLAHFHIYLHHLIQLTIVLVTALVIMLGGMEAMRHVHRYAQSNRHTQFQYIENLFSVLMAFTACAMIFAHGSNDVAIAIGPVTSVISTVLSGSPMHEGKFLLATLLIGYVGVISGLLMYGRKVIETVGNGITMLTPSRAFAATFAAASTVVGSTTLGIPVSATQTLVGAVFGVGLARGIDALNLTVMRNIFLSWALTIPVTAGLATFYFYLLGRLFGLSSV
ncbi:MAG TPA: inorganic phosphate transporter [Gammaproteobacteria bacterium]|nr:inorganic phosphate transporter [Gammaproteobacteria bacterium]